MFLRPDIELLRTSDKICPAWAVNKGNLDSCYAQPAPSHSLLLLQSFPALVEGVHVHPGRSREPVGQVSREAPEALAGPVNRRAGIAVGS